MHEIGIANHQKTVFTGVEVLIAKKFKELCMLRCLNYMLFIETNI